MSRHNRLVSVLLSLIVAVLSVAALAETPAVPDEPTKVKPLQAGAAAPAFTVRDATGEPFRFEPKALQKPAVMIFYRGGWCPYCNAHLGQLRKAEPQLLAMGYAVLFLSADRPELLRSSLKEKDINYTLLSDANMNAARAFGIAFRVDDATVEQYKKYNIDLEAASGATHHELPVPAVFIVDRTGVIRFAHSNPDYKVRLSGEEILAAARKAQR
ncbi:MAG: peroxiredoxin-like family protein [Steroidobacteraceae bacterium]